jgi:hypothetical protein
MKRPTESDFEINVTGAGVEVTFKPTKSHYSYNRLVDQKDVARFGPISPARVRHAGATGDTGDYSSHDVEAMALRLAADAVRRASRRGRASADKASKLAAKTIERLTDKSRPLTERARAKRRLIHGPKEFRDIRADQPKQKR